MPGGVGEHLFEQGSAQRNVRVAQPPGMASNAGNPQGGKGGVLFLGYFLLDKQKKVTAPPGQPGPKCICTTLLATQLASPCYGYIESDPIFLLAIRSRSPVGT